MNVFQPFARPVWISVLVIVALRFVFLYVSGKMYPPKHLEERTLAQLLVAMPLKQASRKGKKIKSNGLRVLLIFYVFGFFIIFTIYKAALVTFTAIPVIPSPIGITNVYR